ncbi:MAG: class IV adenylate cyclase [Candidatus Woesearchaeota archaeon]
MEIEVKILEVDVHAIIASLERLGAECVFDGRLRAVFFDRGRSLRDSNVVLRVRSSADTCIITVGVLRDSDTYKRSEEYEFSGSFDDALAALRALGFEEYARSEKHRSSYRLGCVRVDIDRLLDHSFVPPFLELEGDPHAIEKAVELLGLSDHHRVTWTGAQVIEHYRR